MYWKFMQKFDFVIEIAIVVELKVAIAATILPHSLANF